MTIQEILAAQQRASNATRKAVPARPAVKPAGNSVADILAAQRKASEAARKVIAVQGAKPAQNNSVAEIIARQRATAAAQKAATAGISPALSGEQKAIIESIKERYHAFLAKLDQELAGQELFMTPPAAEQVPAAEQAPATEQTPAEPIFAPNVPANAEVVVDANPVANGISVGSEMGGQVTVSTRPKRQRKPKAVAKEPEQVETADGE